MSNNWNEIYSKVTAGIKQKIAPKKHWNAAMVKGKLKILISREIKTIWKAQKKAFIKDGPPTYNQRVDSLKRCIALIETHDDQIVEALNQDYKNIEIIIVDDGSIDNSVDVASDLGIQVFTHPHEGYGGNLFFGLNLEISL